MNNVITYEYEKVYSMWYKYEEVYSMWYEFEEWLQLQCFAAN